MLAVPLKRALQLDLVKPLKGYITKNYSEDAVADCEASLNTIQQLRNDAMEVTRSTDIALLTLSNYYHHISSVFKRFPVSTPQIKLSFSWIDCLKPPKKHALTNGDYELAALLFNMAAIHSFHGVEQDRSALEGLKASVVHYQRAAGLFAYVRDTALLNVSIPALDANPHALTMLEQLMLAQAQATFVEKASRDCMADKVKAKLAAQAGEFYRHALDNANKLAVSGLDESWAANIHFQLGFYKAQAEVFQSACDKEEADRKASGYGVQVARLIKAESSLDKALAGGVQGRLPEGVMTPARDLLASVRSARQEAQKDLNSIYHEKVPEHSELPAIGMATIVKPLAPDLGAFGSAAGAELFPTIVPVSLTVLASEVSESVAQLGREVDASGANEQLRATLASVGLPASVEAHAKGEGVPANVWDKVSGVQDAMATWPQLSALVENNARASRDAEAILQNCRKLMSDEEAEDAACKRQWGTRWDRQASSVVGRSIHDDIQRFTSVVQQARSTDATVGTKLQQRGGELSLLQSSRQALDSMMPASSGQASAAADASAKRLQALLLQMGHLVQARERHGAAVTQFLKKYDALEAVMRQTASAAMDAERSKAALVSAARVQIEEPLTGLRQAQQQEPALLQQILDENQVFTAAKAGDAATAGREAAVQRVLEAVQLYTQLRTQLTEGGTFWSDLTERCRQLQQTATDHVYTRTLEKQDLLQSMTNPQHQLQRQQSSNINYVQPRASTAAAAAVPAAAAVAAAAPVATAAGAARPDVSGDAALAAKLQAMETTDADKGKEEEGSGKDSSGRSSMGAIASTTSWLSRKLRGKKSSSKDVNADAAAEDAGAKDVPVDAVVAGEPVNLPPAPAYTAAPRAAPAAGMYPSNPPATASSYVYTPPPGGYPPAAAAPGYPAAAAPGYPAAAAPGYPAAAAPGYPAAAAPGYPAAAAPGYPAAAAPGYPAAATGYSAPAPPPPSYPAPAAAAGGSPPPAYVPPGGGGGAAWACRACTFQNPAGSLACGMCGGAQ